MSVSRNYARVSTVDQHLDRQISAQALPWLGVLSASLVQFECW